jgi:hypothetical protein
MALRIIESLLPWSATSGVFLAAGGGKVLAARQFSDDIGISTDNGETWTLHAAPNANYRTAAAYGNGVFVLVGDGSTVRVTPDGDSWSSGVIPTFDTYTSITFGNGRFVALSDAGNTAWSTDGESWTMGSALAYGFGWTYVGFNGTHFVTNVFGLPDYNGIVYVSTNGSTWTQVATPDIGNQNIASDARYSAVPELGYAFAFGDDVTAISISPNGTLLAIPGAAATEDWEFIQVPFNSCAPMLWVDGIYVTLSLDSGTNYTRLRSSSGLSSWTYDVPTGVYRGGAINRAVAFTDAAALFVVDDDVTLHKKIIGYSVEIPPTQFWEDLVGTTQR